MHTLEKQVEFYKFEHEKLRNEDTQSNSSTSSIRRVSFKLFIIFNVKILKISVHSLDWRIRKE